MFLFKRKPAENLPDLSWLKTDIHSHFIPGIDDGSPDIETSLEMIRGMHALGYKKIITTPHVLWEIYPNKTETILEGCATLRKAVKEAGIDIEVEAAAEYFLDDHFEQELKNGGKFLPIRYKMLLVEFSMVTAPLDLQQMLFDMQIAGYQPVIAHPERYIYLTRKKEFFAELKDAGCFFQLNLLSLTGHYGRSVQDLAEYLIGRKYYNFAGTDMHNMRHLESLTRLSSSASFKRLKDSGVLKNNVL
jgi:protein-tyrosine phosphatase